MLLDNDSTLLLEKPSYTGAFAVRQFCFFWKLVWNSRPRHTSIEFDFRLVKPKKKKNVIPIDNINVWIFVYDRRWLVIQSVGEWRSMSTSLDSMWSNSKQC
jgi:hypothetical protein